MLAVITTAACTTEENTRLNQLVFSVTCHLLVLNHPENGKTGTCPLQLKDEKLKDDNAERPAECFTALRTEPVHTSTLAPWRSWISQRPHWAQFLTSYFRSALEILRLFTFCSMVLHECFFLGFGAFLAVPVSVVLPSVRRSKTVHYRGCFGACDWIYQYKLFKLYSVIITATHAIPSKQQAHLILRGGRNQATRLSIWLLIQVNFQRHITPNQKLPSWWCLLNLV